MQANIEGRGSSGGFFISSVALCGVFDAKLL